jgi:hypothetical protein
MAREGHFMSTPIRWNASISGDVLALQARWKEVRKGLKQVVLGYCFLVILGVPGLVLLFLTQALSTNPLPALTPKQVLWLGWILTGTGMVFMFSLLLMGQRRCLNHAPQLHGSREWTFTCLLCTLVCAACLGISWGFGDTDNFKPSLTSWNPGVITPFGKLLNYYSCSARCCSW